MWIPEEPLYIVEVADHFSMENRLSQYAAHDHAKKRLPPRKKGQAIEVWVALTVTKPNQEGDDVKSWTKRSWADLADETAPTIVIRLCTLLNVIS